jgi:sigma-B regulation protein RsbU (phosphoserine phosphatase)
MPGLSGIDLCRELRGDPAYGQPYVILVTGRNTKMDLVAGMDAGADDFIAKPFNGEELRVRVQAGVRLLDLRDEAKRRSRQLASALEREAETNRAIRRDLALAARMQRESLPTGGTPFPELDIGTYFRAAAGVAGDGYDFFRLDDRHLGFFLIDVTGHGVASAMLSFTVSRFLSPDTGAIALRGAAVDGLASDERDPGQKPVKTGEIVPPHRVVAALNRRFLDKDDGGHYFTMVYGVLNVDSGLGSLCQAGHPHPLIVGQGGRLRYLGSGGFPVGMLAEATYESVDFRLGEGERLIIYSDGITDCRGTDGSHLGSQRLTNLLAEIHPHPLAYGIDRLGGHLDQWQGDATVEDDMSLLAIERLPSH